MFLFILQENKSPSPPPRVLNPFLSAVCLQYPVCVLNLSPRRLLLLYHFFSYVKQGSWTGAEQCIATFHSFRWDDFTIALCRFPSLRQSMMFRRKFQSGFHNGSLLLFYPAIVKGKAVFRFAHFSLWEAGGVFGIKLVKVWRPPLNAAPSTFSLH